jgi:hypothetical protein
MPESRCSPLIALALVVLPAAACGRDDPRPVPPSVTEAFAELPFPPDPSFVGRAGGADALTISVRSSEPYEAVLAYYRQVLAIEPWVIRSDARDGATGRVIYAERGGRPLWVRLRPEGTAWTLVDLTGAVSRRVTDSLDAVPDTATPAAPLPDSAATATTS